MNRVQPFERMKDTLSKYPCLEKLLSEDFSCFNAKKINDEMGYDLVQAGDYARASTINKVLDKMLGE